MTIIHLNDLSPREAQRALFIRLFDRLAGSEPQVPVRPEVCAAVIGVRDAILAGEPLYAELGLWGIIFDGVRWSEANDGTRIGGDLLRFAGHLGEALKECGPSKFSTGHALMLMFAVVTPLVLKLIVDDGPTAYLIVTAEGSKELGLTGRVNLGDMAPMFDTPQELLEELFNLNARARREDDQDSIVANHSAEGVCLATIVVGRSTIHQTGPRSVFR